MEILNKQGLTEKQFLEEYNPDKYEKPSVAVDLLIFTVTNEEEKNYRKLPPKEFKLLLIKRKDHPYINQWALPGGFVRMNENLEEAALRELKEEANVDKVYIEQLYTWGDIDRDPRMRVISASYMSLVDSSNLDIKAGDDAEDAAWFAVKYSVFSEKKTILSEGYILERDIRITLTRNEEALWAVVKVTKTVGQGITSVKREILDAEGIAFDHGKIIQYGIERLRNKIEYTDIAFNLMPQYFTLTELQQVYEIILDKELLTPNFRRKIAPLVIETNQFTKDAGHRPSKYYKFNANWEENNF